ncbi:unnamed protein product [Nesidiocoris tenuis]|uniref:Uncharacterized protein n=1 Tax=Nesidiocoris tenuis TaxID=355587 RepID=A0A6H5HKL8_9HEMI|nr:unnamed protein product [Nesidiocoris tenuis]
MISKEIFKFADKLRTTRIRKFPDTQGRRFWRCLKFQIPLRFSTNRRRFWDSRLSFSTSRREELLRSKNFSFSFPLENL